MRLHRNRCDPTAGRPFGAERVHLVDASCFPDIPATNLTLTIMANAWRIATESCMMMRQQRK